MGICCDGNCRGNWFCTDGIWCIGLVAIVVAVVVVATIVVLQDDALAVSTDKTVLLGRVDLS